MSTEQLMTQEELAFRWKISEATLERDRSLKKGVRYMKLGGLIRYRLQDVLDYEDACVLEPAARAIEAAPPKREWVGLTMNEAKEFYEKYTDRAELINALDKFLEEKNT